MTTTPMIPNTEVAMICQQCSMCLPTLHDIPTTKMYANKYGGAWIRYVMRSEYPNVATICAVSTENHVYVDGDFGSPMEKSLCKRLPI